MSLHIRSTRFRWVGRVTLVLAVLLVAVAPASAQDTMPEAVVWRFCSAEGVALRPRPAVTARPVTRLGRASRVRVLAEQGAWTQIEVEVDGGTVGWVPSRQLVVSPPRLSDAEVRRILVRASIDAYDGRCPCPYFTDRAGRSCGRRSAWSREDGESPYCYPNDVPVDAVTEWRAQHEGAEANLAAQEQ